VETCFLYICFLFFVVVVMLFSQRSSSRNVVVVQLQTDRLVSKGGHRHASFQVEVQLLRFSSAVCMFCYLLGDSVGVWLAGQQSECVAKSSVL